MMVRLWYIILPGLFLSVLVSCNRNSAYQQKLQSLDSLSGAFSNAIGQVINSDTVKLRRYLDRFEHYRQFLVHNIPDTLSRETADHLRHFMNSGKQLQIFAENRRGLSARASLMSNQFSKLKSDIIEENIPVSRLNQFMELEKQNASLVINAAAAEQKKFHEAMEQQKLSLPFIEDLIRSHNKGLLPGIVEENID